MKPGTLPYTLRSGRRGINHPVYSVLLLLLQQMTPNLVA